jgi:hypothetical protein
LRAFPYDDVVVARVVSRLVEALKAISHHMLAGGEILKDKGLSRDRRAAEPIDPILDTLQGKAEVSGYSAYAFALREPSVDFFKVDGSFRIVMDGKGSLRVGFAAGVAPEALDGSHDQGVVKAELFPIALILCWAIVVVATMRIGAEQWLHGKYLHGASTRTSYSLLA